MFKGKIKGYDKTVVIKDMEVHNSRNVEDWKREIQIMRYVLFMLTKVPEFNTNASFFQSKSMPVRC